MHLLSLLSLLLVLGISVSAQSIVDAIHGEDQLTTLSTLVNAQPALLKALGDAQNITLLAPTNDAFAAFLASDAGKAAASKPDVVAALLTYHVVAGTFNSSAFTSTPVFPHTLLTNASYTGVTGGQVVEVVAQDGAVNVFSGLKSKSTVTKPDLAFKGGVIHIIDAVLTIPPNISTTALRSNLTQLASAVTSAGLLSAIDTTPNITVFAPTDAAFSAIADTIKGLSKDQIAEVLKYHVVPALGYSSSLKSGTSLPTLEGKVVNVTVDGSAVKVNNANVVLADVIFQNGVVHVIDAVLSPPSSGGSTSGSTPSGSTSAAGGSSSGSSSATSGGLVAKSGNFAGLLAGLFLMAAFVLV